MSKSTNYSWRRVSVKTELRPSGNQETKRQKKKRQGRGSEMRSREESRRSGNREIWADEEPKKKKKSASLLDVLFFPWWSSFSGSEVKWGRGRRVMVGLGCWGWRVIVVVCARFFFLFCAYRASYQLLSGDGSLSRCMAALWCLILSRYSCWETASTDARISSSSQSVRPETQTHKTYENF